MKRATTLLLFAILPLLHGAAGAAELPVWQTQCEKAMKPELVVDTRQDGYQVDNTVSSKVLNNRAEQATISQRILGMTQFESRVEVSFDAPVLADAQGGRECVAPRIAVALHFMPMKVYVAREFPASSCSFRTVLAHEMRHVAIYHDQLPKIALTVRQALAAHYADAPLYADIGHGQALLENQIDTWLRPMIQAELTKLKLAQAAMDSDEETYLLSSACHGEVAHGLATQM